MFYSNSNIDTEAEFDKRRKEAEKLASADQISLVADDYDHGKWLREVACGLESEPEKGSRCAKCFRFNLKRAAAYAAANGYDAFATSLTVSPHKISPMVFEAGDESAADVGARFLHEDFKKKEGFKLSLKRSEELALYRQSYCGCEFSRR